MQKVYCGPNIMKYSLMKFQVFTGEGYAFNVKEAISAIPEVENLFCEVNELENMRAKINQSGTAEHVYYETVEKKIRELSA